MTFPRIIGEIASSIYFFLKFSSVFYLIIPQTKEPVSYIKITYSIFFFYEQRQFILCVLKSAWNTIQM